jgi:hypothetical protein
LDEAQVDSIPESSLHFTQAAPMPPPLVPQSEQLSQRSGEPLSKVFEPPHTPIQSFEPDSSEKVAAQPLQATTEKRDSHRSRSIDAVANKNSTESASLRPKLPKSETYAEQDSKAQHEPPSNLLKVKLKPQPVIVRSNLVQGELVPVQSAGVSTRKASEPSETRAQSPSLLGSLPYSSNRVTIPENVSEVKPALTGSPRTSTDVTIRPEVIPLVERLETRHKHPRSAGQEQHPTSPIIRVNIGRVEVRAVMPSAPSAPPKKRARPGPILSLEDYLRERNGR